MKELNFPISPSKLVAPAEEVVCLGIVINTKKHTLSITKEKLTEIMNKCQDMVHKKSVTKRKFIGSYRVTHVYTQVCQVIQGFYQ